jgi:diguanylate cyclase (GGDEF)-like protein
MLDTLKSQLQRAVNFPSPPTLAMRIIDLMSGPDVDIAEVAAVISKDPGMTAKMLRVANSGLYAKRRKSENLRQAIIALGLNAASTIALSFSLVDHFKKTKGTGIDYSLFWRRALLSATVARAFGSLQEPVAVEEIFLAALLQDLGVLAIDRVQPEFYANLPAHASHAELIAYERQALDADHSHLGAWLMCHWQLPDTLCEIVAASHAPNGLPATTAVGRAARCLALGSDCADLLLLQGSAAAQLHEFTERCVTWLGIDGTRVEATLANVIQTIPEIEQFFDMSLVGADVAAAMLAQAHELMTARTLQAMEQVNTLEERSRDLAAYTAALEDKSRRDALTGVYNRGYLDHTAQKEFRNASAGRWPLSVVFADLDRFKAINDTYGHAVGDLVLQATARILVEVTRDSDVVARYGGEEFVILLPGTTSEAAQLVCERLLARLRATEHVMGAVRLHATASLGLATHTLGSTFANVDALVDAADRCVYTAKKSGRNRLVIHGREPCAPRSECARQATRTG